MDTNRGAKGSIKDRLMSLLYRIRYKKYLKKKKSNIIKQASKNKLYINEDFIKSNSDILLNINNKEIKSSNTLIKSSIKNEFYKATYIFLSTIKITLKLLEKDVSNKNKIKIDNKNEIIKTKIKRLNNYYNENKNKYNISNVKLKYNLDLLNNIEDFDNKEIKNKALILIKESEEEIDQIINRVNELEITNEVVLDKQPIKEAKGIDTESVKLQENINNKFDNELSKNEINNELENNDKRNNHDELIVYKEEKNNIDNLEEKLKEEIEYQNKIVEELYDKSSKLNIKYETKYIYPYFTNIVTSLLKIMGGIFTIPVENKRKKLFGIFLINRGIKNLKESLELKEVQKVKLEYEDMSNKIKDVKDKLEYTNILIIDSLEDIKSIKEKIDKELEYNRNDELITFLDKVIELEKKLNEEYENINKVNNKLDESDKINKNKMKKIELIKENNHE